jgi:hypothetical protein
MTPEEFMAAMQKLNTGDEEADHSNADKLMCEVLKQFGYEAGVEIFIKMTKWYA